MTSWRKASFSGAGSGCVEVRGTLRAVRDSKNPTGPILTFTALSTFVAQVAAGQFASAAR